MASMDILPAGDTSNLEPPGKISINDESTVNNNLHNHELDNDIESSDSDDFLTLKAIKNRVSEARATSAAMEVDSTSDKENRGEQNNKSESNININDNNSNSSANNILNNFKSVGSRSRKIIDSDSDDDDVAFNKKSENKLLTNSSPEKPDKAKSSKTKRKMKFNSDSESENEEEKKKNSHEDDEEPEKAKNSKTKRKMRFNSDSESENEEEKKKNSNKDHNKNSEDDEEPEKAKNSKTKRKMRFNSDSESENEEEKKKNSHRDDNKNSEDDEEPEKAKNSKTKRKMKFNSDSESENEEEKKKNSHKDDNKNSEDDEEPERAKKSKTNRKMRFNSDSESENEDKKNKNTHNIKDVEDDDDFPVADKSEETSNKIKKFSTLIDSESEDESYINNRPPSEPEAKDSEEDEENTSTNKKSKKEKKVKKKSGSKRAAKDEAMKQIHSETQRLLREAPVSLPYHKPKQRSLEEFLNRKKKIVFDLPAAPTNVAKVKMSAAIVSQVLEEKQKEAELFFESSDSEEEKDVNTAETENKISSEASVDDNEQVDQSSDGKIRSEDVEKKLATVEESQENIDKKNEDQQWTQNDAKAAVSRRLFHGLSADVDNQESENVQSDAMEVDHQPDEQVPMKKDELNIEESSVNINVEAKHEEISKDCPQIDNDPQLFEMENDENHQKAVDKVEHNSNKKIPLESHNETTASMLASRNLPDEDDEFSNNKMMTDEDIEKLIEEEEKLSKESSSKIDESVISSDEDDLKIKNNKEDLSNVPEGHILGLPPPIFSPEEMFETPKIPASTINPSGNAKKHILSTLCHGKPKLKGAPGMVIDLTSAGKPDKEAINSLVDRFLTKHSAVTKNTDDKKELTVLQTEVTADGLKVVKDILPYKIPVNDNEDPELSKPGAKLVRLKEDLKKRMASRRNEEWKQKEKESQDGEDEEEDEFEENNEKLMDEDEDEGESEPEEDDVPIRESKRKHCDFGDEEAEVSEDEDAGLSEDENEEDEEEDDEKEEDEEDEEENDAEDEKEDDEEDQEQDPTKKQKKFSRIVKMDEDSNSADENNAGEEKPEAIKKRFDRTKTDIDIFDDDEDFPSYQIPRDSQSTKSPIDKNFSQLVHSKFNEFSLPCSRPTQVESPPKSIPSLMNSWNIDSTQTQDNNVLQRKLFQSQEKPVSDEDLLALCSGGFTDIESSQASGLSPKLNGLVDTNNANPISESQLLSLCSGKFDTQLSQEQASVDNNDETSQDFHLTFDENSQSHSNENSSDKMAKKVITEVKETTWKPLTIASSSEDEVIKEANNEEKKMKKVLRKKKEKKKVKQLVLSDDEEDGDQVNSNDEEEEEEEDGAGLESDDEEKFIDYDSEENEVVVVPKKDIKKVAKNFLEAEAELSESEWGSEDEDEKELDKLELEEGDAEEIDEDHMRDQLGKLHARQVLDDDQRDVRMLKEMLFDDGDLHADGAGRERRFKWKNIDKLTDDTLARPIDEDEDENAAEPSDMANEIEWRKLRMEREKFLEEKIKSADEDLLNNEIASGGQLFKLGMKVLKKKKNCVEESSLEVVSSKPIIPRTVSELMGTPVGEKSKLLHNAMKRGSFLARGDEALARLAVVIKQTDNVVLGPKHSKNFLFTHLSPSVNDAEEDERSGDKNEMKADNNTRKRKSITGGTPKTAKKAKTEENRSAKKLF